MIVINSSIPLFTLYAALGLSDSGCTIKWAAVAAENRCSALPGNGSDNKNLKSDIISFRSLTLSISSFPAIADPRGGFAP